MGWAAWAQGPMPRPPQKGPKVPGGLEGPSNSYSQQVSSVSTANAPPREASVSGAGTAQNRNETQVPRNKKKEESREARAAALALAHEKRLKQEQGNTEGDLR